MKSQTQIKNILPFVTCAVCTSSFAFMSSFDLLPFERKLNFILLLWLWNRRRKKRKNRCVFNRIPRIRRSFTERFQYSTTQEFEGRYRMSKYAFISLLQKLLPKIAMKRYIELLSF